MAKKKTTKPTVDLAPYKEAAGDLEQEHREHADMLSHVRNLRIETESDREFAAGLLREVKDHYKEYEARRKSVVQPLNSVVRTVNSWFKPVTSTFKEAETIIKDKLSTYVQQQLEHQRQLREAAAEAETTEEAEAIFEKIKEQPAPELPSGIRSTKKWQFDVEDEDKVPREFLCVDSVAIAVYVKEAKEKGAIPSIPGIRFYQKEILSVHK